MQTPLFRSNSGRRSIAPMTTLVAAIMIVTGAVDAAAQIIRPGAIVRDPTVWTSLSAGLMQLETISDYPSDTDWDFGSIIAWRASVEKTISRGTTVGLAGMMSRPGVVTLGPACPQTCEADANVFQILAMFRGGGGRGLHQVIEVQAGATGYSNFRERSTDARLRPLETVWDPTISLGYGLGYTISPSTAVQIIQDYGLLLHRTGSTAPANASRSRQWYVTRIGFRYGL